MQFYIFIMIALCSLLSFISCNKALPTPDVEKNENFNASIRVTEQVLNTVKPLIFGDNIEWTNNGMGLWLPEKKNFDDKLVEEFRNVGITHLRYPGGTLSDYFDWYKAVGTNRQTITNPFNKNKKEYPHFGPEEFMTLCKKLGIPGTITFNAGTGKPEDAVGWVKYLKSNNFEVTDFTVGNEIYLAKSEESIMKTAEQYADFYTKCKEGIEKVAPDTKLGAISLHDAEYMPIKQNRDWMYVVLSKIGDKIDFIDVHNGYAPITRGVGANSKKRYSDDEFALCFLGASDYVRNEIAKIKDDLAKYSPDGGKKIDIHITEYGPLVYPIDKKHAFDDLTWNRSLTGALYLACLFDVILKEPKITSANHLPFCQDVFGALIRIVGTSPDRKYWRNSVYYVFQMYSSMKEREVLSTTAESPTYSTPAMGFVSELKDIPYIESSAYRTKDGKKLSVFLINRDIKRNASVTVDTGFSSYQIESVTTLTADSYKAENTPEKQDNVIPIKKTDDNTKHSGSYTLVLPKHSLTKIDITKI